MVEGCWKEGEVRLMGVVEVEVKGKTWQSR